MFPLFFVIKFCSLKQRTLKTGLGVKSYPMLSPSIVQSLGYSYNTIMVLFILLVIPGKMILTFVNENSSC